MASTQPSQSTLITPEQARALAHGNLLRVFAERNAGKRLAAIPTVYHPSINVREPNCVPNVGHAAVDATVVRLFSDASKENWDFVPIGEVKFNHDFVYLAWGFGPRTSGEMGSGRREGVEVKTTGADAFLVDAQTGLIRELYVIIDGLSDARGS